LDVDLVGDEHVVKYEWRGATSTARCRWLLDATGRDTFMGKKLELPRVPTQDDRRIATYAHFRGVFRNEGDAAGHITIVRLPGGWFWFIPLDAEKTSVGYVQRVDDLRASGRRPEESFDFVTQNYKELHTRLREAERIGEIHTTADYSYRFENFTPHPRVLFVGDAAGFTDPIFSSGVMMAMKSARLAARLIGETDLARQPGLPAAQQRYYTREVGRMMMVYIKMITAFYDNPSFELFMHPAPVMKIPDAIVAIVGGATELPFRLWWRMKVFYLLCSLQQRLGVAPRIDFRTEETPREPDRKPMQETTTAVAPDSIRYSSPALMGRSSGTTSLVPLSGARRPPPGRGTPFTSNTPRPAARSLKCPRLTYRSLPSHPERMMFWPVPGTRRVARYDGSR
jgi:hypothetical protein